MATTGAKKPITVEEYLETDLGDGVFELVRGVVVEYPPGMPIHGLICGTAAFLLADFGSRSGLGYALCNDTSILTGRGPDTVRAADVCFFSESRWPRDEVGWTLPPVAPDVIIEVYPPGDSLREFRTKIHDFLDAGTLMVWVVRPDRRTVTVYRLDEPTPAVLGAEQFLENLPELPGFRCRGADFFE